MDANEREETGRLYDEREERALFMTGLADECYAGDERALKFARLWILDLLESEKPVYVAAMLDGLNALCGNDKVVDGFVAKMAGRN